MLVAELTAGVAWAAPAPVRVEVASEALDPKHAKTVGPRVHDATEGVLRDEHGVLVADDATTIVAVELRPITKASERDKVIFRVTVLVDGKEVYAGQPTSCWGCDEAKLLASVRTQVAGVVEHLPEAEAAVEEPSAAEDGAAGDELEGDEDQGAAERAEIDDAPVTAPSLTVRNVGIGLTAVGGAALGVGVGLAIAKERSLGILEAEEEHESVRPLRPTGVALAIVGGAVLVGGVVALVVHGTRKKRATRAAWAPVGGPGFVGFAVERRF